MNPGDVLKHHPLPIAAHFEFSLVLTYALPRAVLQSLLPPGLELDTYGDDGFVAIALVRTHRLRPAFLPGFCGLDFFLTGYRIFVRYRTAAGQKLRGLLILRSDTDRRLMRILGNALTHYHYHQAHVAWERTPDTLHVVTRTADHQADLELTAHLGETSPSLPAESPFPDWVTARRFAGPMPFTFGYEAATHAIIRVEGLRTHWQPRPVRVTVQPPGFFQQAPFAGGPPPRLANAFFVENISYLWRRGVSEALPPLLTAQPTIP
jgi:hypothetical protein